MGILNYSTTVAAIKSAHEVEAALANHGASSVTVVYGGKEPRGIAFVIDTQFGAKNFRLPANAAGVERVIVEQQRRGQISNLARYRGAEQANRVAWRILKDWIVTQLAVIESGVMTLDEAMLPYMLVGPDRTLSEAFQTNERMRLAIESGDK